MMPRNLFAGYGVLARRTLQGFDKTQQRSERRAQLVAGVGDEVDAHALDAPGFGQIAQAHHGSGLEPFDLHRRDMRFKPAFHRQTFDPDGLLGLAAGERARHRVEHVGGAKAARERFSRPNGQRERLRRGIDGGDMGFESMTKIGSGSALMTGAGDRSPGRAT